MKGVLKSFENFLNIGFGKRATQYLREGATFNLIIDKEPFSLSKYQGKMEIRPDIPKHYEVRLEITSSAIEFLSSALAEDDVQERLGQLIYRPTPERYAIMKIEAEPTEEGMIDFYWQGFFFWARRMGFVS